MASARRHLPADQEAAHLVRLHGREVELGVRQARAEAHVAHDVRHRGRAFRGDGGGGAVDRAVEIHPPAGRDVRQVVGRGLRGGDALLRAGEHRRAIGADQGVERVARREGVGQRPRQPVRAGVDALVVDAIELALGIDDAKEPVVRVLRPRRAAVRGAPIAAIGRSHCHAIAIGHLLDTPPRWKTARCRRCPAGCRRRSRRPCAR
jgi:hypothetical protein